MGAASKITRRGTLALLGAGAGCAVLAGRAQSASTAIPESRLRALVAAYPDHLEKIEGDDLVWRDGTRMPIGNDRPERAFAEMLRSPTLADQLRQPYRRGKPEGEPALDFSPGRLRHTPFFTKMYGDCTKSALRNLTKVVWMPKTAPQSLRVTSVNDVAGRLERMQPELEALSARAKGFLVPSAGTDVCRPVADTGALSMHAYAAAIDLNVKNADYWNWHKPYRPSRAPEMPQEIVEIFERNGFIWGGKWYHYDTMHFEYRPELLAE